MSLNRLYKKLLWKLSDTLSFRRASCMFITLYIFLVTIALYHVYKNQDIYRSSVILYEPSKQENNSTDVKERKCFHNIKEVKAPQFLYVTEHVYVLNGFYDTRNHSRHRIQILAMAHATKATTTNIYCSLYNKQTSSLHVSQAEWHPLHVQVPALYQAFMLSCGVADYEQSNPCRVYISINNTFGSKEQLTVPLISLLPDKRRESYKQNIGVCLPPLHGIIPQARLVEMIEFNKLLGADSIFLYHYNARNSTNPNTEQVIDWYNRNDRAVTTYKWNLPVPDTQTWNYAHKLAIQHCLYTNMWTHKYLLFVDPDEILVPKNGKTWTKMIKNLESVVETLPSGYCFPSVLFPPQFNETLISVGSTSRSQAISRSRSKCLVRPEFVQDMGLFNVDIAIPKTRPHIVVDRDIALIHHYRHCYEENGDDCTMIEDRSAISYRDVLLAKFSRTQKQLSKSHLPEPIE